MRPWIGRKFAHHRRTKRRLNQWVRCHGIQTRGFLLARLFRTLRRGASRGYAVGFFQCPFGTGGTRVRTLSHRERPGTPKHGRSTVSDTEAIQSPEDPCGSECLLVPRGGIEPPTRGFSVRWSKFTPGADGTAPIIAGEPASHALFALTLLFAFYILRRA